MRSRKLLACILGLCAASALQVGCAAGGFARAPAEPVVAAQQQQNADDAYAQGVLGATLQQTVDAANRVRDAMQQAAIEATKQSEAATARGDAAEAQAQSQAAAKATEVANRIEQYQTRYVRYTPTDDGPQLDIGASVSSAAAAVLPPPWNALAILAVAGWGILERQRGRGAARAIVNAIDAGRAQRDSPLRDAMSHAATKEAIQRELSRNRLATEIVASERVG